MFFITCFKKISKDDLGWLDLGSSRTFGYYDNFKAADEALKNNYCDMYETIYYYAIIEHIEQGIHSCYKERWFYKYNKETKGYLPIEAPEEFKHCYNIALG